MEKLMKIKMLLLSLALVTVVTYTSPADARSSEQVRPTAAHQVRAADRSDAVDLWAVIHQIMTAIKERFLGEP